jgi:hypothetical protein
MKRISIALYLTLFSFTSFAQDAQQETLKPARTQQRRCPSFFLNTSTGFNNNTGMIGIGADYLVVDEVSLSAGAGIGSWGSKLSIGARYHLKPCMMGWAFGLAVTNCGGLSNYQTKMETVFGTTETVALHLYSQTNLAVSAFKYWRLGRGNNRIHLQLGWSAPLSGGGWAQFQGAPISDNSRKVMDLIRPGGLIIATGFSFGLN